MEEGSGGSNKLPVLKKLTRCREERILSSHSAPAMTGGTLEGTGLSRTLHKDRKWKGDKWGEK